MQINKNKISKDEKKLILYNSLLSWLKVNSINVRFTVYTHAQPKVPEKHGLRSACARFHRPDRVQGKEIRALRLWGMYLDSPTVYCLRSASSLNGATFNFKGENV